MSVSIRSALESLVGQGSLLPEGELERWRTGPGGSGIPGAVALPRNEEETAQILGRASEEGWKVIPAGLGGWLAGGGPTKAEVVVSTRRMRDIQVYEPADLTFTAGAGLSLESLREATAPNGQWLPLDPPGGLAGSLGAAAATGVAGSLRHLYGTARDHVLGLTMVSGDGTILRWGGQVVKNVAGFDVTRLSIGSWGCLGVVTSVSARLFPIPESDVTLVTRASRLKDLLQDARSIALSSMPLAAVELMDLPEEEQGGPGAGLVLRLLGSHLQVAEMEDRLRSQMARDPAEVKRLEGEESLDLHGRLNRWEEGAELVARLALLPSELDVLLREAKGLRDLASTQGLPGSPVASSVHVGAGILRVRVKVLPTDPIPLTSWSETLRGLRRRLEKKGGSLTLSQAPPGIMKDVGAWGVPGAEAGLMAGLKARFDPSGILAPGRLGL